MLKECTNCEGDGHVTRWGAFGHEVPSSRRIYYPHDSPDDPLPGDGEPRKCPVCNGDGYREDEWD